MGVLVPDAVPNLITNPIHHCCAGCGFFEFVLPHPLQICGQCRSAFYCSKECQRADWGTHSMICTVPSSIPHNHPPPQVIGYPAVISSSDSPGSQHYSSMPGLNSTAKPEPTLQSHSTAQQDRTPVTGESILHPAIVNQGPSQSMYQGTTATGSSPHSSRCHGQKQNRVIKKTTAPNPYLTVDEAFQAALAAFVFPPVFPPN